MGIRPGKAVWKSGEYDFQVEVIRYLGTTNGVKYYLIRSDAGETGVPETELEQKQSVVMLQDIIDMIRGTFK